mmetsp:Transcript_22335/g.62297  ORF Transcript_22335/g.62297 Transcript_22335/m.62297 type:complete len:113 (+) Transcript_22335:1017-1355(+)
MNNAFSTSSSTTTAANNSLDTASVTSTTSSAMSSRDELVEGIMKSFQRKGYRVTAYEFKSPTRSPAPAPTPMSAPACVSTPSASDRLTGVPDLPLTPAAGDSSPSVDTATTL